MIEFRIVRPVGGQVLLFDKFKKIDNLFNFRGVSTSETYSEKIKNGRKKITDK
jgi:hypothetical protein